MTVSSARSEEIAKMSGFEVAKNSINPLTLEEELREKARLLTARLSLSADKLDTFTHVYASAVIAKTRGNFITRSGGALVEIGGVGRNIYRYITQKKHDSTTTVIEESLKDISNNEIGIAIAEMAETEEEIVKLILEGMASGEAIIEPVALPENIPNLSNAISATVSRINTNISAMGKSLSEFFKPTTTDGSDIVVPFVGNSNYSRSSNLSLEGLIGSQIGRASNGIVDRIIGNNPNIFEATVGRTLSRSVERFADALAKGRIQSMEDAFTSVLGGKNGVSGFAAGIGNQVIGGLLQSGISKLFGSTKTHSYETARSIEAGNAYRLSQSQQAAEALAILKKGERNL